MEFLGKKIYLFYIKIWMGTGGTTEYVCWSIMWPFFSVVLSVP